MGNHQVVPSNIQTLQTQNWVQAGQDHENALFSNVNPYRRRLLANIITQDLIEQYELNFITEEDYNSYIMELSYRQVKSQSSSLNSHNFLYPIRYFVNKSKHEMCTTIHTGYLYADKVELRLKQINDIPFQDLIYMYKATLTGFKTLYEKVGYFDIVQEMIFITKRGEVKVWMNANLAKNYPNYQKNSYASNSSEPAYSQREVENIYGSQADMIRKLILMIEKNSDEYAGSEGQYQQQNQLFSEFLEDKNLFDKLSFQHSLDQFQNYLCQNNLHSPDYMKSIPQLFAPDQYPHNAVTNYQQSHVNEITSQHLTQIKKKFEPMETILQDERINTKTTNKTQNTHKNHQFQENNLAMYTPQPFTNQKQPHLYQQQHRKVVRPGQYPFTDMNQSRYSYQSNSHVPSDYGHLQRSTNSNNLNLPSHQNLNAGCALNYSPNLQAKFGNQQHIYLPHQNFTIPYQQIAVNGGGYLQSHQISHSNQMSHKVVMCSQSPQPPTFTANFPHQQIAFQNQNIKFPVQSNPAFQQSQASSQADDHTKKNVNRNAVIRPANNVPTTNQFSSVCNQPKLSINAKEAPSQSPLSSVLKSNPAKQQSQLGLTKKIQQHINQKSKIKYFSTKDSYQLDEEIANDLEKFLGLKVD